MWFTCSLVLYLFITRTLSESSLNLVHLYAHQRSRDASRTQCALVYTTIVLTHVTSNRKTRVHVHETRPSLLSPANSRGLPLQAPVRPLVRLDSPAVLSVLCFSVFRNTMKKPLTHTAISSISRYAGAISTGPGHVLDGW